MSPNHPYAHLRTPVPNPHPHPVPSWQHIPDNAEDPREGLTIPLRRKGPKPFTLDSTDIAQVLQLVLANMSSHEDFLQVHQTDLDSFIQVCHQFREDTFKVFQEFVVTEGEWEYCFLLPNEVKRSIKYIYFEGYNDKKTLATTSRSFPRIVESWSFLKTLPHLETIAITFPLHIPSIPTSQIHSLFINVTQAFLPLTSDLLTYQHFSKLFPKLQHLILIAFDSVYDTPDGFDPTRPLISGATHLEVDVGGLKCGVDLVCLLDCLKFDNLKNVKLISDIRMTGRNFWYTQHWCGKQKKLEKIELEIHLHPLPLSCALAKQMFHGNGFSFRRLVMLEEMMQEFSEQQRLVCPKIKELYFTLLETNSDLIHRGRYFHVLDGIEGAIEKPDGGVATLGWLRSAVEEAIFKQSKGVIVDDSQSWHIALWGKRGKAARKNGDGDRWM